jgi:hypothetical protein
MMTTAWNWNVKPEGMAFSRTILRKMPLWYYREADQTMKRLANAKGAICLRKKHKVKTIGDAEITADLTNEPNHKSRKTADVKDATKLGPQQDARTHIDVQKKQ